MATIMPGEWMRVSFYCFKCSIFSTICMCLYMRMFVAWGWKELRRDYLAFNRSNSPTGHLIQLTGVPLVSAHKYAFLPCLSLPPINGGQFAWLVKLLVLNSTTLLRSLTIKYETWSLFIIERLGNIIPTQAGTQKVGLTKQRLIALQTL